MMIAMATKGSLRTHVDPPNRPDPHLTLKSLMLLGRTQRSARRTRSAPSLASGGSGLGRLAHNSPLISDLGATRRLREPTLNPLVYRTETRSPMLKVAWQTKKPAESHRPPRCSFYRSFQSSSDSASSTSSWEPGSSPSGSQPNRQDY